MRLAVTVLILCLVVTVARAQDALDAAIREALDAYHTNTELLFRYVVLGQHPATVERAGVVYMGLVSVETGEPVAGVVEYVPVILDGARWQVTLPGQTGYTAALEQVPPQIWAGVDATPFKPSADPALVSPEALSAYGLPFVHGEFGTVTRSFGVHGTGTLDFDLTGRDIVAAKDGVIVYADDRHNTTGAWWYWNLVIIQHGEHEYTLYGHLAPNSIPTGIKDACTPAGLPMPNCEVPVTRGERIGAEGNTGRSTNPHLHIEFGQSLGFVAYPDLADDDRDGNRDEPVWTAYLYAEQNAAFVGYTPDEVRDWSWGRVEQAAHFSGLPLTVNGVYNGDFSNGTQSWRASGQLNWNVSDGILRATRLQTTDPPNFAAFYQFVNYSAYAGQTFEVQLLLGNESGIAKSARVELLSSGGQQHGIFGCTFEVAPQTPLAPYALRGTVRNTWANMLLRVSVNPADGSPSLLVDDVQLARVVSVPIETSCILP